MRRREFISLLGGTAAGWPLAARAQQPAMPVVGFLSPGSPDTDLRRLSGVRKGLKELGYIDGQNVTIEYRGAGGQIDRLPALAAELVRREVAVIIAVAATAKAARSLGLQLHLLQSNSPADIDAAFEKLVEVRAGGLVISVDPFLTNQKRQIVALAAPHAV